MCVFRGDSSAAAASPGDRWGGQQKAAKCVKRASKNSPFARKMPGKALRSARNASKNPKFLYIHIHFRGDSSAAAASPGDRWGGQQKAAKCVKKASKTARLPQNARQRASRNAPRGPTGATSLSKRASWHNGGNCTFRWVFVSHFVVFTQAGPFCGPAGRPAGAPELGKNPSKPPPLP